MGVSLVADRFGNEKSAVYIQGNLNSYLNLGTSPLLKPKKGTISLWMNLDREVRTGSGYPSNPIITTKNSHNHGWYHAYGIGYELATQRLTAACSIDSTMPEATSTTTQVVEFNKWHHLVLAFDNDSMWFYMDGRKQTPAKKGFETVYLEDDSVVVAHSAHTTNVRFALGVFDDIQIFHRVLTHNEVQELYEAPNPDKFKRMLYEVLKYAGIVLIVIAIIIVILIRNKRKLKQQKEYYELKNRIAELEIKVVKTQMNPHFISNCLAAIQELIYSGQVDKAGLYIAKFSLFLRQVLDHSDKTYITLSEELESIKLNIELEQLRFKKNFVFELKIEEGIRPQEISVPSLITQPIIENAIWHGLLPLKEQREPVLFVHVYAKEKSVFFEITDNGVGRVKQKSKPGKTSRGMGLVQDKLESLSRLTDSQDYKLKVVDLVNENNEACGTKVIIQLDNTQD